MVDQVFVAERERENALAQQVRQRVLDALGKAVIGGAAGEQCAAVFTNGRWQWMEATPKGAHAHLCPACHRTNDGYPAGEPTLSGGFLATHGKEWFSITNLVEPNIG